MSGSANPSLQPRGLHVLAKPMGPVCQIKCDYCFYLEKRALFGLGEDYRMPDDVLAAYTAQYVRSQPTPSTGPSAPSRRPTRIKTRKTTMSWIAPSRREP